MFFSAVITIAIEFPELGPAKYWCAEKAARSAACIVLFLSSTIFFVTLFCYIQVIRSVGSARINIGTPYSEELPNLEAIVAKKVSSYLLIYLLQWVSGHPDNGVCPTLYRIY